MGGFSECAVGTTTGFETQRAVRAAVEKSIRPFVRQKVLQVRRSPQFHAHVRLHFNIFIINIITIQTLTL